MGLSLMKTGSSYGCFLFNYLPTGRVGSAPSTSELLLRNQELYSMVQVYHSVLWLETELLQS